jgi:Helix-turn-helix domain
VSVEAISWALNLAPVPRDGGGKPNPACKAVLIGLANHASPDGKDTFPSEKTLIRYTCLSKRTVQTALHRLQAEGIIQPCDPAVVAAKIKRADRRTQGWDLAMHLVRDDLGEEDLVALERQFPGLTARLAATRAAAGNPAASAENADGAEHGVQRLHPAAETPVDNVTDGVQQLHPAAATGCNHRANEVQLLRERGAAVAPEPSIEPSRKPSAARVRARGSPAPVDDGSGMGGGAGEFFASLGPDWPLTSLQRTRLAPMAAAALEDGWKPAALAAFVGANTAGVRSPAAVLTARLSPAELPSPPSSTTAGAAGAFRPPWCGLCDERTRRVERADGFERVDGGRCPRCHPLVSSGPGEAGKAASQSQGGPAPAAPLPGGGCPSKTAVSGTVGPEPTRTPETSSAFRLSVSMIAAPSQSRAGTVPGATTAGDKTI